MTPLLSSKIIQIMNRSRSSQGPSQVKCSFTLFLSAIPLKISSSHFFIQTTLDFEQSNQTSSTVEDQKQQEIMMLHKDNNENVRRVWKSRKDCLQGKKKKRADNIHKSQQGNKTALRHFDSRGIPSQHRKRSLQGQSKTQKVVLEKELILVFEAGN